MDLFVLGVVCEEKKTLRWGHSTHSMETTHWHTAHYTHRDEHSTQEMHFRALGFRP